VTVQDDVRQKELILLFNLREPEGAGRSDTDAVLDLGSKEIHFELKSTTKGSVTTVRDFGKDHIEKWRHKHWLIGFYDPTGRTLQYTLYGSPAAMAAWIDSKAEYIAPDLALVGRAPERLTLDDLYFICGKKKVYRLEDAKRLQKDQYRKSDYHARMDIAGEGYSPHRMLAILKDRCRYLLARGSTLNNPKVPLTYFIGWEQIPARGNPAARLREMVRSALQKESAAAKALAKR
jgi:hypothetical protein